MINVLFGGEGAKMIVLNFTPRTYVILKFREVQKEYSTWALGANIIFLLRGNEI